MKVFNHIYTQDNILIQWIKQFEFTEVENILIQVYFGKDNHILFKHIGKTIKELLPNSQIIMTTSDGEISDQAILRKEILISVLALESSRSLSTIIENNDYYEMGVLFAQKIPSDAKFVLIFLAGEEFNADLFLNGLHKYAPKNIIVSGGIAVNIGNGLKAMISDGDTFAQQGVVGAFLSGVDLNIATHYNFPWYPVGFEMSLTKVKNNRIYEIDGYRAIDVFSRYLGDDIAMKLPHIGFVFPLLCQHQSHWIGRACLKVYEDGSLLFGGNFETGQKVRFGIASTNSMQYDALPAVYDLGKNSEAIFAYPCLSLRRLYSSYIYTQIENLPLCAPLNGCFLNGEFFTIEGHHYFLNESFTSFSISEKHNDNPMMMNFDYSQVHMDEIGSLLSAMSYMLRYMTREWEKKFRDEIHKNSEQNEKMIRQSKMAQMGDMVAMIAHQWRQPLNVISGLSIDLSLKAELDEIGTEDILNANHRIQEQCQKMSQTIDIFLNFSKSNSLKTKFDIIESIEDSLLMISHQLTSHNIMLIKNLTASFILYGNKNELEQVLINLLTNARDAHDENENIDKKQIVIQIDHDNRVLTIEDNAGGINPNIAELIFNPYFTTKAEGKGTGLGLFMSKKILEESFGATIHFISIPNGSRFEIKFPELSDKN